MNSRNRKSLSASILVSSLLLLPITACGASDPSDRGENTGTKDFVDEKNYGDELIAAATQFEVEFIDFYLSIGNLTEDLLTDFLENSDDANKGYLAAIKRIRSISDSTDDFFRFGAELDHLTSDEIDQGLSEEDRILILELNPLVVDSMNFVDEFLQVSRNAATALSIVDKPTWVLLQDDLVEIAQKYYETGTARGRLYRSLGERLGDENLRASFFDLGETF